jgi:hypothetical protein
MYLLTSLGATARMVSIYRPCVTLIVISFFCIAAPGKTNDAVAIHKTSLLPWLDALPPVFLLQATVPTPLQNIW